MRSAMVRDENGNVCTTTESQQDRWRRHFNNILNVQSEFDMEELERVTQRQLKPEIAELPTEEELLNAIEKVKNGRAGGESSILPEMVKDACIGYEFSKRLLELVHDVWEKRSVPDDWRDAILIPIPKKGDLSHCDNWRGISHLDVIEKIVSRILQKRLQKLAEDELPDLLCGFKKGRSCADMIFTVHQLVDKSLEHESKAFFTFLT